MRTIIRRLQRIEESVSIPLNDDGETLAEVLRARIRRRCEAEGVPFADAPPELLTDDRGRPLSVAAILRWRLS
jgi:hypothetical protein